MSKHIVNVKTAELSAGQYDTAGALSGTDVSA